MTPAVLIQLDDLDEALAERPLKFGDDFRHRRDKGAHGPCVPSHAFVLLESHVVDPRLSNQSGFYRISELIRVLRYEHLVTSIRGVGEQLAILLALPTGSATLQVVDMIHLVSSKSALKDRQRLERHVLVEEKLHAAEGIPPSL